MCVSLPRRLRRRRRATRRRRTNVVWLPLLLLPTRAVTEEVQSYKRTCSQAHLFIPDFCPTHTDTDTYKQYTTVRVLHTGDCAAATSAASAAANTQKKTKCAEAFLWRVAEVAYVLWWCIVRARTRQKAANLICVKRLQIDLVRPCSSHTASAQPAGLNGFELICLVDRAGARLHQNVA